MARVSEGIGKTYDEAVQDGLNKIGLSKNQVSIEIVREPKKTFFSILEPRQVKVIITEIEEVEIKEKKQVEKKEIVDASPEDIEYAKKKVEDFLIEFFKNLDVELDVNIKYEDHLLKIDISGEKSGLIIGYRGETLDALQILVSTIVNKKKDSTHIKVLVDAENYRKKRAKTLEELALKIAKTVVSKRKSFALEPMIAFERKVIHETLQNHPKVKTVSTGEEPYRKVVISLK